MKKLRIRSHRYLGWDHFTAYYTVKWSGKKEIINNKRDYFIPAMASWNFFMAS